MRFFASVVHLEHGGGDDRHFHHVKRGWVHHHGGVHAVKGSSFEEQDLSSSVSNLFGWSANNADGKTCLVRYFSGGDAGAHRHGGDNVMATRMADSWKSVIFRTNGDVQRAGTRAGDKGGREITNALLNAETGVGQSFGDPIGGFFLLEA